MRVRCYDVTEAAGRFHQVDGPAHFDLPGDQVEAVVGREYDLTLKPAKPVKAPAKARRKTPAGPE